MEYRTKLEHNRLTVNKMALAQYNTFQYNKKVAIGLAALILIVLSIFNGIGGTRSTVLLCLGCWVLVCVDFPARKNARATMKALNQHYPTFSYLFSDSGISVSVDGKTNSLKYSDIIRLVEDADFIYMFVDEYSSYMFEKKKLEPRNDQERFRQLLEEKTAMHIEKAGGLLSMNLKAIKQRLDQNKK